jgi:hypothetical protein
MRALRKKAPGPIAAEGLQVLLVGNQAREEQRAANANECDDEHARELRSPDPQEKPAERKDTESGAEYGGRSHGPKAQNQQAATAR